MFNTDEQDEYQSFEPINKEDFENYGTCCVCGCESSPEHPVRNFICLGFKHPSPGHGWGCAVCGLPPDGAIAVICDRCLEEENFNFKEICGGFGKDESRLPFPQNPEKFEHDESKHQESENLEFGISFDPAWDYSTIWQQLSLAFRELSKLQSYISDQENATVESDLHIYSTLKDCAEKLTKLSELLVHPAEDIES